MRKGLIAWTTATLIFTSQYAFAVSSGNELLNVCQSNGTQFGRCIGFIEGVSVGVELGEAFHGHKDLSDVCIPANVTNGQLKDIVLVYLRQNPATRHEPAVYAVVRSLRGAFPCGSRR